MSLIKRNVKIISRETESPIAKSELKLEIENFDDFLAKRDQVTSVSVQLTTNSDATWTVSLKPFEATNKALYMRIKVRINKISELLLKNFNVEWFLYVNKTEKALERKLQKIDDNFNVNVPFLQKHVNKTGSLNLRLKMTIKSVGHQKLSNKALMSSVPIYTTLKNLLNDESLSDFKFMVGQREFKVHKAILAASSPMLKQMFTVDMKESNSGTCEVKGFEPDTFVALLTFVYCGDLPENFAEIATQLYQAANFYQIDRLEAACAAELQDNLTEANALEIYKWVRAFDKLKELKAAAWNLIKFNILKIFYPLEPMHPEKIDEILRIRQMESDFWKKNKEN